MNYLFFGTAPFAAKVLRYLIQHHCSPLAVVTRPDRPKGRSLVLSPPAVKEQLLELSPSLPLYQPEKASSDEFVQKLATFQADLFVVVAYGEILKEKLLALPKWGAINVHASLLPKYRGAAPMQRCLMQGEDETGVTIMRMVREMDAGAVIRTVTIDVPESMTCGELEEGLSRLAGPALLEVMHAYERGEVAVVEQDVSQATFAPKLTSEEEKIDWRLSARQLHNLVRALSPSPGAWAPIEVGAEKKRLKIKRSAVVADRHGAPGEILAFGKQGWLVATGEGALQLLEVQLEGKKTMKAEEFVSGMRSPCCFENG